MFVLPSAAAQNHLLTQNGWASERLARFAGKTARSDIAPFSFAYAIFKAEYFNMTGGVVALRLMGLGLKVVMVFNLLQYDYVFWKA